MAKITFNNDVVKDRSALFTWDEPYAAIVYRSRPWCDATLDEIELDEVVAEAIANSNTIKDGFNQGMDKLGEAFGETIDNYDWGIEGKGKKKYRRGSPTMKTISDSDRLKKSLKIKRSN